ncbi:GntR family transcriptional regulator [Kitasatospora sp. NBC_01287]|uniref:GntR family transcriptional regulator n=1 Tax=Kitasatospora sp. NBC_01287 TaxID=2903573 RepID=UPI0022502CCF|nr:GntR family transcriptional regulator [Kitasatospora sp. NBC_01287]MCX4750492.1 GntR family transcriptional regulator [Kitasatospora sp. NBC_01287]
MNGHAAIAADIERRVADGRYPTGRKLPSEQALAQEYATTRARVRTALASLARRGLLVSRPNSGWLVQAGHRAQTVGELRAFSRWAAEQGRESSGRIVHRERGGASAREARLLGIGLGEEVLRFTRVRTLDGRAVMVERSTWAPWVVPVIDALPDDAPSVFGALDAAGVRVLLGDHRIEAVAASSDDARLLNVRRSSPLLQVSRTSPTVDGRLVEVAVDRYVSDAAAFDVRAGDVAPLLRSPGE